MSQNDKDSKKQVESGEMKKEGPPAKGGKNAKKDPKAPKEEELVRISNKRDNSFKRL